MNTKTFYFSIPEMGIRDFVDAFSFVDAKARAWRMYPEVHQNIVWEDTTDPLPVEEKCAQLFF